MKVLIVEDEKMAADRLEKLLLATEENIQILDKLDSVKRAVTWLKSQHADLLFFDIQLADGLSFEILEKVDVQTPIIFTTAFDEYAIKAFKVNSIDYLLKPIDPKELKGALLKYKKHHKSTETSILTDMTSLALAMRQMTKQYKERFVVKVGEHLKTVSTGDIRYIYSQEKTTFLNDIHNRNHIVDFTLEQVQELLDPQQFFRINRKYLIHMSGIKDIITYSNSRLRIILQDSGEMDAIVSREKVQNFKAWLDQ